MQMTPYVLVAEDEDLLAQAEAAEPIEPDEDQR